MKPRIRKKAVVIIATCLMALLVTTIAGAQKGYFISPNYYEFPEADENVKGFWPNGFGFSLAKLLPISLWKGYQQNWTDLSYGYMPFNRNADFPIPIPYQTSPKLWGKGVHLFSVTINMQILFVEESKPWVPYLSLGYGIFKRTRTEIHSDLPEFSRFEINYKMAGLFCVGFGWKLKITNRYFFVLDNDYVYPNTTPKRTFYWVMKLGLEIRSPRPRQPSLPDMAYYQK